VIAALKSKNKPKHALKPRDSKMEDDEEVAYNRSVALQAENDFLKSNLEDYKKQLAEQQQDYQSLQEHLDRTVKDGDFTKQQLATQRETVSRLKTDLDDEKASNANTASFLSAAYADHATTKNAQKSIVAARDRFEADLKDSTSQFASLLQQWQESQEQIALQQSQRHELQTLEATVTGLQSDIDRLQNSIADHERTIIVKDERINHLERQFQKERQRNLDATDAAAAAAAASPMDAPPQPFTGLVESLADELEATSDDGEFEYEHLEHLELSDVIEVVDFTPIAPASYPALTFDVSQAGSVSPIAPAAHAALTIDIAQAGSICPISAAVPRLSLVVSGAGSVKPIQRAYTTSSASAQTVSQVFTTQLLHTATFDVAPIAPVDVDTTHISTQTDSPTLSTTIVEAAAISVTPIEPAAPSFTTHVFGTTVIEVTPVEPIPARVPTLSSHIVDAATIAVAPVEPSARALSIDIIDAASFSISPIEPASSHAPFLTLSIVDAASIAVIPIDRVASSAPVFTSRIIEGASIDIAPIDPVSPLASILTTSIIETASVDITPIDLVAPPTPTLTTNIVDSATIAVSPVEQVTTRAPALTTNIFEACIDLAPLEAELPVVNFTMAPITVTHEDLPFQAPAFSTVATPITVTSKPGKTGWFHSFLPWLTALLAIYCMVLFNELDDWRTANGVGYTYGNNNDGGAYGNGRYFLGIPIAMDIGNSWWEEQIARYASVAITRFEDWAGISNAPLY
jgi:hypothetical protein